MAYVDNSRKRICNVEWTSKRLFQNSLIFAANHMILYSGLMDKDDMKNLGFADLHNTEETKK